MLDRRFFAGMLAALAFTACTPPPEESSHALQQGWQPSSPYATTCDCQSTNGTCDPVNCTIACNTGYADCDGVLNNGCETPLNTTSNCGACGRDCSCFMNASCGPGGTCRGSPRSNGTLCNAPQPCNGTGICSDTACICGDARDMAHSTPVFLPPPDMAHGNDLPASCSMTTAGGTATAWLFLAASLILLMRRRRSR